MIMRNTVENLRDYCRSHLSPARYEHLERVYQSALEIVRTHGLGLPAEDLEIMALGHDIARELPGPVSWVIVELDGIELTPWEREFPLFCHSRAGAVLVRKLFGVEKPEILEAIYRHTLGGPGLSDHAKVLYAADFLDPRRPFLSDREFRRLMALPLDRMVYEITLQIVDFLREKQKPVLPPTEQMLAELKPSAMES